MIAGTDINDADSDNDGLTDGEEVALGTDATDADSDNDGQTDGAEVISWNGCNRCNGFVCGYGWRWNQ